MMNLIKYIKGQRKGKDAHRLERTAMQDAFLSDALDGFDMVEGNHAERIRGMRRRLMHHSSHRRSRKNVQMAVALTLLICMVMGGYFLMNRKNKDVVAQGEFSIERSEKETISGEYEELLSEDAEEVIPLVTVDSSLIVQEDISSREHFSENSSDEEPFEMQVEAEEELQEDVLFLKKDTVVTVQQAMKKKKNARILNDSLSLSDDLQMPTRDSVDLSGKDPEPVIGMQAYKSYLKKSVIRPMTGKCAKKKGKVLVSFKISADGRPVNMKVVKSLCFDQDREALRLVQDGPKWIGSTDKAVVVEVFF